MQILINKIMNILIKTVGFDREIFGGNPSLKDLEKYTVKLSAEEKGQLVIFLNIHIFIFIMPILGSF